MASKKILIQIQVGAKDANIAIANVEKAMQGLSEAQIKVNKNYKDSSASAGLHNAILMESGRLASDLNYGFTAVANNLGQLFSLFQASADSAGGLSAAFSKLLSVQALFLIGGQILIQNLDKIWNLFKGTETGVDALNKTLEKAGETTKGLAGNFETYIRVLQSSNVEEKDKIIAVEKLNDEYPDFIDNLDEAGVSMKDLRDGTKEATEQIDLQREAIFKLSLSRAAQSKIDELAADEINARRELEKELNEEGITNMKETLEKAKFYLKQREEVEKIGSVRARQRAGELLRNEADKGTLLAAEFLRAKELREEEIDSLIKYIELVGSTSGKTNEYQETTIGNVNKEISLLLKLRDIRNEYVQKRLDLQAKSAEQDIKSKEDMDVFAEAEVASIEKKRELALLELQDLEMSEGLKGQARADINAYYDELQIAQADERRIALDKINKLEEESKLEALDNIGKGLMAASNIAGKSTGVGKALAVAGTLVSTYSAGQKAYESQMTLTPDAPIRAQIARAAAILQGLANVRAIMSVKSPAMKETSAVTGGQGNVQVQAPDFNVVGQGGVNQLGQVIGSQFGQPIRAYVVSGDISSAQELDRSITAGATID